MKRFSAITILLALLALAGAPAQQPPGAPGAPGRPGGPGGPPPSGDPLARFLFPPDLVMQQQQAIALTDDQRAAITRAIKAFQEKVVDLQWRMQEETERLGGLLDKPVVDQGAALAQVDKVLAVERDVKRAHLGLLIQIKNELTAEQQAKLAQARVGGS